MAARRSATEGSAGSLVFGKFPLNYWYVAAFSADLGGQPLGRRICGKPIALYRTQSGKAVAVEDRCIHRGMPLTHGGECFGERIQCPYHGLEFDSSGICVRIPGQERIPPQARLRAYPIEERDGFVWIWPGDAERADDAKIPQCVCPSGQAWRASTIFLEFQCDWQLLADGFIDTAHVGFVHKQTVGVDADTHTSGAQVETSREGDRVIQIRHMPNSRPPPLYSNAFAFTGNIDRWQEVDSIPGLLTIWTGGMEVNTGAYDGRRIGGFQLMQFHGITPSTATTSYHHLLIAANTQLDNPDWHARLREGVLSVALEDKPIIEAQQRRMLDAPGRPLINTKWDAAALYTRVLVDEVMWPR